MNQKGEIVLAVMATVMVATMIFGGMFMMHGGHDHHDHERAYDHGHQESPAR